MNPQEKFNEILFGATSLSCSEQNLNKNHSRKIPATKKNLISYFFFYFFERNIFHFNLTLSYKSGARTLLFRESFLFYHIFSILRLQLRILDYAIIADINLNSTCMSTKNKIKIVPNYPPVPNYPLVRYLDFLG
jgi:hypothetical protein